MVQSELNKQDRRYSIPKLSQWLKNLKKKNLEKNLEKKKRNLEKEILRKKKLEKKILRKKS